MFGLPAARRAAIALVGASLMAGCADEAWYGSSLDTDAAAIVGPEDKASIYVARADRVALPGEMLVSVDGTVRADLKPNNHVRFEEAPGTRTIAVRSLEGADTITLRTVAGRSYFVLVDASWGSAAPIPKLREADGVEGRRRVVVTRPGKDLAYTPMIPPQTPP